MYLDFFKVSVRDLKHLPVGELEMYKLVINMVRWTSTQGVSIVQNLHVLDARDSVTEHKRQKFLPLTCLGSNEKE